MDEDILDRLPPWVRALEGLRRKARESVEQEQRLEGEPGESDSEKPPEKS